MFLVLLTIYVNRRDVKIERELDSDATAQGDPGAGARLQSRESPSFGLAEHVLGAQSGTYQLRGYGGLSFGDTREAISNKNPIVGKRRRGSQVVLQDGSDAWFSPADEFVGIATVFSQQDNERSAEKLRDLFGSAQPDNIEHFTTANAFDGTAHGEAILRVTYHFAETVICARFVGSARADRFSANRSERVFVAAFDRTWVAQELALDYARKRRAVERFVGLVGAGHGGGFDKDMLPDWGDARKEETTPPQAEGVYWSSVDSNAPPQSNTRPRRENAPNRDWFAAIVTQSTRTPDYPMGTVFCTLRLSLLPGFEETPLRGTTLHYLIGRVNSILAQEFFPPRGETISRVTNGTKLAFEWFTNEYLKVSVTPDNALLVVRRADK